jgi:hypothetical protein
MLSTAARTLVAGLFVFVLTGCGGGDAASTEAAPKYPWKAMAPDPVNETLKFPVNDQVSVTVVADLGWDFLPGGNLGLYKNAKKEYRLFLVRLANHVAPANALLEFKNRMENSKIEINFGGYSGLDKGAPLFVFTKGVYLLGIQGLTPAEADPVARSFAGRVPAT